MVQNSKWPSFIIQGVILGCGLALTTIPGKASYWTLLSIALILVLFVLQSTSTRLIYLFPVRGGKSVVHWDTHMIRIGIMLAALFLSWGVGDQYGLLWNCLFTIASVIAFVGVPMLFNFYLNDRIQKSVDSKYPPDQAFSQNMPDGAYQCRLRVENDGVVWEIYGPPLRTERDVSWWDFVRLLEAQDTAEERSGP